MHDPGRVNELIAKLDLSAADRASLDGALMLWLLSGSDPDAINRHAVMQAWVERNPKQPIPAAIAKAFSNWCHYDIEKASTWVMAQPSGPQYDAFAGLIDPQRLPGGIDWVIKDRESYSRHPKK